MALTDPELDLLREMLSDDPADEVFLQVGEEYVRRSLWADAAQVLSDGLPQLPVDDPRRSLGYALLARASLETGRYDVTVSALAAIDVDPAREPENARIELLCLERSGQIEAARVKAAAFLLADPNDIVVLSLLERIDAPPPDPATHAKDRFYTVARAEHYVDLGRPDRAIRVYRRILLARLGDDEVATRIEQRLRQLSSDTRMPGTDDLSEELTDPGLVPELPDPTLEDVVPQVLPRVATPSPSLAVASATPAPAPAVSRPPVAIAAIPEADPRPAPVVRGGQREISQELEDFEDDAQQTTEEAPLGPDDEQTDLQVAPPRGADSTAPTHVPESGSTTRDRRKRRSLLRR